MKRKPRKEICVKATASTKVNNCEPSALHIVGSQNIFAMICLFGVKAGGWDRSPWRDRLRRLRKCSISFWGAGNFTVKDSFVLSARPWATDSTLGSQLCPGACTYPFFLFWLRVSGDRLNNHPGVLPESQDEEGQEAQQETEQGGRGGGGDAEEVQLHVASMAQLCSGTRISSSD